MTTREEATKHSIESIETIAMRYCPGAPAMGINMSLGGLMRDIERLTEERDQALELVREHEATIVDQQQEIAALQHRKMCLRRDTLCFFEDQ